MVMNGRGKRAREHSATRTKGSYKGGRNNRYVFDLYDLKRIPVGGAGTKEHYANTRGAIVEGERMQVGLAFEKRGCGAQRHTHPNEQFNFVVKGTLLADIAGHKRMRVPAGSVVYFPANVVHRALATPDEDVVFFVVKDLSHGIAGKPAGAKRGTARYASSPPSRRKTRRDP
jgi:quercetin dioxygenase-like cupin family protein